MKSLCNITQLIIDDTEECLVERFIAQQKMVLNFSVFDESLVYEFSKNVAALFHSGF